MSRQIINIPSFKEFLNEGVNATGDCYEANAKALLNMTQFGLKDVKDTFLVHGEVEGQGEIEGLRFGHCWIEQGFEVIDKSNGRDIKVPKSLYYKIGKIDKTKVHKYTPAEARKKLFKAKHYGPWDLKTSTGL